MKTLFLKFENRLGQLFLIPMVIYFAISMTYFFFFSTPGGGDETLFINDLLLIKSQGWNVAIAKNISIPYMLLAYPISFLMKEYFALRLVNVLLTVFLFYYFRKIACIRSLPFYGYLMFYMATSSFFVGGTNDIVFFIGIAFFLIETFYFLENKKMNAPVLAFGGLVIAFFTREMIVVYLPVVILAFYFLLKNGFRFNIRILAVPAGLFALFVVLNLPCLEAKHKLSYDDKSSPAGTTWRQHQYLAQMLVNEGKIPNFKHQSWDETVAYLKKNGPDSLPKTVFESLIFDWKFTMVEFFKDFYYSMFFGLRQLGLILIFLCFVILNGLKNGRFFSPELFVPLAVMGMVALFSLIVISFIELRWLIAAFLIAIVYYSYRQSKKEIDWRFLIANYAIFVCFSLYGVYNLLPKLLQSLS